MSRRRKVVLFATITVGALIAVVALVQWELSRECVRWSTRIDVGQYGKVRWTRVCAEFQPRQHSEEPPFDEGSPKAK